MFSDSSHCVPIVELSPEVSLSGFVQEEGLSSITERTEELDPQFNQLKDKIQSSKTEGASTN